MKEQKKEKKKELFFRIGKPERFVEDLKNKIVTNICTPPFKQEIWILQCPHCLNTLVQYEIEKEDSK